MRIFLLITTICGLIVAGLAAESRGVYKDPRYPDKCVVGDLVVSPGEEVKHPFASCGRMLCGHGGSVVFQTCGIDIPPDGYELGDPLEPFAPYPKCCDKEYIPIPKDD
ncbi:uncharacterized protein ACRADG_012510 [Cochliomyia hominivorax]